MDELHLLFCLLQMAGTDKNVGEIAAIYKIDIKLVLSQICEKFYKEMKTIPFSQELKKTLGEAAKLGQGYAKPSDLLLALLNSKSKGMPTFRKEHRLGK